MKQSAMDYSTRRNILNDKFFDVAHSAAVYFCQTTILSAVTRAFFAIMFNRCLWDLRLDIEQASSYF